MAEWLRWMWRTHPVTGVWRWDDPGPLLGMLAVRVKGAALGYVGRDPRLSMRIGLLSDVHANLFALRAAVARLRAEGVDAWVCAGDLVGYGAHPNECVETIAELEPTCVAGNHELMLLEALPDTRAGWLARRSIGWTRGVVRADVRSYLAALPRTATVAGMAVAHGSPETRRNTSVRTSGPPRCCRLSRPSDLLVLGHTHRPWLYGAGVGSALPRRRSGISGIGRPVRSRRTRGIWSILEPSASRASASAVPRARFALIDLDARARPLLRRAVRRRRRRGPRSEPGGSPRTRCTSGPDGSRQRAVVPGACWAWPPQACAAEPVAAALRGVGEGRSAALRGTAVADAVGRTDARASALAGWRTYCTTRCPPDPATADCGGLGGSCGDAVLCVGLLGPDRAQRVPQRADGRGRDPAGRCDRRLQLRRWAS